MKRPTDTTPKPRTFVERIGGKDWYLEERELDAFEEVALWNENPRLLTDYKLPDGGVAASEIELEEAIQRTRGYDNLRKSIEQIGQMEAIYVWRKEQDTAYLVLEGSTRVAILRELSRKREGGPESSRFRKVKAKVLPPEFGELERVILLARIHVRGTGVRSWGRYIEAKFIHDHVTAHNGSSTPMMSVTDMARHMEKSVSWVQRLRDAYEFGRHFVEHVDTTDAEHIASKEFSVLEEISKAALIGPRVRDYQNREHDPLRAEVFDMVKNEVFGEYRDARFMKEFYEDPEKWALLKSGERHIAHKLASDIKVGSSGIKAKIGGVEEHIRRAVDRGDDHGLGDDDVESLERAILVIQQQLHPGVRPFRLALNSVVKALSEASLADVKALEPSQIASLTEAVNYFNELVARHNRPVSSVA